MLVSHKECVTHTLVESHKTSLLIMAFTCVRIALKRSKNHDDEIRFDQT
jgi:hypothetical protein